MHKSENTSTVLRCCAGGPPCAYKLCTYCKSACAVHTLANGMNSHKKSVRAFRNYEQMTKIKNVYKAKLHGMTINMKFEDATFLLQSLMNRYICLLVALQVTPGPNDTYINLYI